MSLNIEQLQVTTFDTTPASYDLSPNGSNTIPPEPNCYSPYCVPTDLPEQCPDTTRQQTGVGAE